MFFRRSSLRAFRTIRRRTFRQRFRLAVHVCPSRIAETLRHRQPLSLSRCRECCPPISRLAHIASLAFHCAPTINSISSRKQNPNRPARKQAARFVQLRCCLCVIVLALKKFPGRTNRLPASVPTLPFAVTLFGFACSDQQFSFLNANLNPAASTPTPFLSNPFSVFVHFESNFCSCVMN